MNIDLGLHINKKDILTVILVSILFFGIAAWNVGEIKYPISNWQSTQQESFYVSLGSVQFVKEVYFFVQSGNASVTVAYGSPGNWTTVGTVILQPGGTDYSVFQDLSVGANTAYLNFDVKPTLYDSRPDFYWSVPNPSDKQPSDFIRISEIGLQGNNDQEVTIRSITGENNTDATISKLVDEQGSIQIPPDYMSKMYFDEVYFARSAEEYLHLQMPLERTHPPLGKLIQAVGVGVFGETPFGWRIMGVIFGTLLIPLMYLLGKKLFGTWIGGFSAAFLFAFDFMHFTMARIGTVDTYVVFFSLLSQLFFIVYFAELVKKGWKGTSILPLFLAVVFFALGFSTKWFTIFGAAGLLALLLAYRVREVIRLKAGLAERYLAIFKYPFALVLAFLGLSVVIYFLSFVPDMLAGDSFSRILSLQNAMFGFHSGSVYDSSSSPWWTWPFMTGVKGSVPKWFDITYLPNNVVSTITSMGNPVVWWVSFAAMLLLTALLVYKLLGRWGGEKIAKRFNISKAALDLPMVYIVVVFFFSWLPYVIISRATYIYHFYLSVPLLCLATTYFINRYWNRPIGKVMAITIFASAVILFIVFYPVISGMPVANSYVDKLKWLQGWYFAP